MRKQLQDRTLAELVEGIVRLTGPEVSVQQAMVALDLAGEFRQRSELADFWREVYAGAKVITPSQMVKFYREEKLEGMAVIHLTRNCQRVNWLRRMKETGFLPQDTREESCYRGSCYKDRTYYARKKLKRGGGTVNWSSVSEKRIELATPEGIAALLKKKDMPDRLNAVQFIRLGQAGDDSHAIAAGLALEWFRQCKRAGIRPKSILVTSAYASTTRAMYEALYPYRDRFVLHVTASGYFTRAEIINRLAEFRLAFKAGLNVKLRLVTNRDGLSWAERKADLSSAGPMATPEEDFLLELVRLNGLAGVVLENPYHNDFLKRRHSRPTGLFEAVCCETGKCRTCRHACLTRQPRPKGAVFADYHCED